VGCEPTHLSASRRTRGNHGGQIRLHGYHTAIWRGIQWGGGRLGVSDDRLQMTVAGLTRGVLQYYLL
jgi:hypothetical protein